jgi:hypothetical protein
MLGGNFFERGFETTERNTAGIAGLGKTV